MCEKDYIWNPTTCGCENGKYEMMKLQRKEKQFQNILMKKSSL